MGKRLGGVLEVVSFLKAKGAIFWAVCVGKPTAKARSAWVSQVCLPHTGA